MQKDEWDSESWWHGWHFRCRSTRLSSLTGNFTATLQRTQEVRLSRQHLSASSNDRQSVESCTAQHARTGAVHQSRFHCHAASFPVLVRSLRICSLSGWCQRELKRERERRFTPVMYSPQKRWLTRTIPSRLANFHFSSRSVTLMQHWWWCALSHFLDERFAP